MWLERKWHFGINDDREFNFQKGLLLWILKKLKKLVTSGRCLIVHSQKRFNISKELQQLFHYLPSAPPTCWRVIGDRSTSLLSPYETCLRAVAEETDPCHAEVSKVRSEKLVAYQIKCVREAVNVKKGWIDHMPSGCG